MAAPGLGSVLQGDQNQGGGWQLLWERGKTPWDAGAVQPGLREAIDEHREALPRNGRAFIPGCGTGYDVSYLAQQGFDAIGLDMAQLAITRAQEYHRNIDSSPGTATFQHGDFFAFDAGEGFDLGYDHTFLCALPPSLRSKWAARWIELLAQPGSVIITSIFPIDGPRDDGPPYAVTFELYDELLGGHFERLALFQPKEGGRKERQRMAIWRRK